MDLWPLSCLVVLAAAFVGLTEHFDESASLCEQTFGWRFSDHNRAENTSPPLGEEIEHLTPRIQEAVQLDIELYEFATQLFTARLNQSPRPSPPLR